MTGCYFFVHKIIFLKILPIKKILKNKKQFFKNEGPTETLPDKLKLEETLPQDLHGENANRSPPGWSERPFEYNSQPQRKTGTLLWQMQLTLEHAEVRDANLPPSWKTPKN